MGISDKADLEKYLADIECGRQKEALSPERAKTGGLKMILEQPMSGRDGDDLKKIIEINNFINTERDLEQLLKIVLNYALQLSKAEVGFVILLDEDGSFIPAASLNAQSDDEEKVSMSIVKMALESGEIVSSADAFTDDRFDASESIVMNELKSVMCLPIKSKN
jgi:transcriptional regulator with GAF, ATPase, and Fis domain